MNIIKTDFDQIGELIKSLESIKNDMNGYKKRVKAITISISNGKAATSLISLNQQIVENLVCRIDIMDAMVKYLEDMSDNYKTCEDKVVSTIEKLGGGD